MKKNIFLKNYQIIEKKVKKVEKLLNINDQFNKVF